MSGAPRPGTIFQTTYVLPAGDYRITGGQDGVDVLMAECTCGFYWHNAFIDHVTMVNHAKTHAATHLIKAVA